MPVTFSDAQSHAVAKALSCNIPFALFAHPDEEEFSFYASLPSEEHFNSLDNDRQGTNAFFITPFGAPFSESLIVLDELPIDKLMAMDSDWHKYPEADVAPTKVSTSYPYYYTMVREARKRISSHKLDKVVISRLISTLSQSSPLEIADKYFSLHPDSFRAIYFTQETGLWITCTPELLLIAAQPDQKDAPADLSKFTTMSLAGTRIKGSDGDWDGKNIAEHDIVLRHIANIFLKSGVEPQVSEPMTLSFGDIEHRLHLIEGHGTVNAFELLDRLTPTPALAGYPIEKSLAYIADKELHDRRCYGGVIGTLSEKQMSAYVNIRCAHADTKPRGNGSSYLFNIYAGGGIMEESTPGREWREAGNKASSLYSLLCPDDPKGPTYIESPWDTLD
ncbi:MAG: chorismate-binding protein [Pseudoflavonifractor sp.]|nr:chorismate-binding protein [Alloprevotella sp.]MCM1117036.1 chorismate-binding protein [Pseudoflavonifractor sp.]